MRSNDQTAPENYDMKVSYHKSYKKAIPQGANTSVAKRGFTIVELLIVIVAIGILAAISLVVYSGVSNSTHDAAVKQDVRNLAQTIKVWELENDAVAALSEGNIGPGLKFAPSRSSHSETYTLYVCRQTSDPDNLVIGARSVSGKIFAYKAGQGFVDYPQGGLSNVWSGGGTNCPRLFGASLPTADYTYSYGRGATPGTWSTWAR